MTYKVEVYDTCVGCTQCVRICPTDVLEMASGSNRRTGGDMPLVARPEDCVGCKKCESVCPTDFVSIRVKIGSFKSGPEAYL